MRRSYLILGALGLIVVTVVWWLFFISPRNQAIDEANERLTAAESEQSRLETTIAGLRDIKENEVSYLVAINAMETSIPVGPELDTFIEDLTFLTEQSGVDLVSMTSAVPADPNATGLYEVNMSVTLEGQYFELLGLLYGLESMDRLVRIDSVQLSPIGPAEEEPTTDGGTDGGTDDGTDGGTDDGTDGGTDDGTDDGTDGGTVGAAGDESAGSGTRPPADELAISIAMKVFTRTTISALPEEAEG